MARKLNKDLFKPHDLCFAPNNHLIVSENGRISLSLEIFTLEGETSQCYQLLCYLKIYILKRYKEKNRFKNTTEVGNSSSSSQYYGWVGLLFPAI